MQDSTKVFRGLHIARKSRAETKRQKTEAVTFLLRITDARKKSIIQCTQSEVKCLKCFWFLKLRPCEQQERCDDGSEKRSQVSVIQFAWTADEGVES